MDAFKDFTVVINDEEQYSIWPAELDVPAGWTPTGASGTRDECVRHIDEVWTDIRPKSLRVALGV
ncbi:MbtH family protein [Amycolatopsis sp. H20-H5]|uniref:MbtH family protein n=1 Tax=Amycolatopsis sp. H20-H5 TaxID=3046309 RepID=UPI002DBD18FE|nr:MbtH family NRPS accessory protein [Amycolatopsis sp. H20-H5]MEC3978297.1 MbtH family NRPS accessory protein [Amycolatopsis sp. H20-H5]